MNNKDQEAKPIEDSDDSDGYESIHDEDEDEMQPPNQNMVKPLMPLNPVQEEKPNEMQSQDDDESEKTDQKFGRDIGELLTPKDPNSIEIPKEVGGLNKPKSDVVEPPAAAANDDEDDSEYPSDHEDDSDDGKKKPAEGGAKPVAAAESS